MASYKKILVSAALATLVFILLPATFDLRLSTSQITDQRSFSSSAARTSVIAFRIAPRLAFADPAPAPPAPTTVAGSGAVGTNPYACGLTTLETCIPFFLFWLIDALGGLLIALGATLVAWLLAFNQLVFSSAMVQTGFSVCLAIANLGFVLGIIVIAIATILRDQTYGAKQLLWKLVVMAILINFGLVITRPIVGISDSFSNYFLSSISGTTSNGSKVAGGDGLGIALTGLMSPQTFLGNAQSTTGAVAGKNASDADQFVADMMTMFFAAIIFGSMIIALMALAVLLFVRYVYLAMLLILLPFAWLMWVFPKFKGQFSEWWNNFIKWTFFPPVALFFMYLVILTLTTKAQGNAALPPVSTTAGGGSGVIAALQGASNGNGPSGATNVLQQGLDDLALAALMIGGLFAAQKMTGEIGNKTVSMAKSASGWATGKVGGLAWKGTKNVGQSVGRNVGDRVKNAGLRHENGETTTALQRFGSRLQGVPGLRGTGRTLAGMAAPAAVHESNAKEIQERASKLKSLTNEGLIAAANKGSAFVNQKEAAAVGQELASRGLLDGANVGMNANEYIKTMGRMGNLKDISGKLRDDQLIAAVNTPGTLSSSQQTSSIAQELVKRNMLSDPNVAGARPQLIDAMAKEGALKSDVLKAIKSDPDLIAVANSASAFSTPEQASEIGQELARRNLLDDPALATGRKKDDFIRVSTRAGKAQDLYNIRPDLVEPKTNPRTGVMETDIEKLVRGVQSIKPGNITEINNITLGDFNDPAHVATPQQIAAALALSPQHLGKLGSEGTYQQTNAYLNTLRNLLERTTNASHPQFIDPANPANADLIKQLVAASDYNRNSPQWQKI